MKKISSIVLLTVAITVICGVEAIAQTTKQIQFAKGKSFATVKGNTGNNGVTYVLRAKSGQKLILNLTPIKQVGIKVETNSSYGETVVLNEERGGTYEVGLEENGDYTLFISSTNNQPVTFTLTVKIARLTDV
jgi:hypothetical protein